MPGEREDTTPRQRQKLRTWHLQMLIRNTWEAWMEMHGDTTGISWERFVAREERREGREGRARGPGEPLIGPASEGWI